VIAGCACGGTVLVVALGHQPESLTPAELAERELTLAGSSGFAGELSQAVAVLAAAPGRYRPLVTEAIVLAAVVADAYAPGHMQIAVRDEDGMLDRLHNAGEILIGQNTTISAANFIIGCPASLPTSGFARVSSGITADAFRKRTAVARADRRALTRMSESIIAFTGHEGFPAHEAAVRIRMGR
jgi:histidinol dehydrogenase